MGKYTFLLIDREILSSLALDLSRNAANFVKNFNKLLLNELRFGLNFNFKESIAAIPLLLFC